MPDRVPGVLRPIAARLERAAIMSDFDGTLAPIVDDPGAARALPGARSTLERLARRASVVAIVTGRGAAFVTEQLGSVRTIGQHGLEVATTPVAIAAAAERLEALGLTERGLALERKSHMLTVHWRRVPAEAHAAIEAAAALAEELGLVLMPAKMGVELRPSRLGKGEVVHRVARAAKAAVYAGDDHGDIPAFNAARRLGVPAVCVAVRSAETPQDVIAAADVVCDGPREWLKWLRALAQ